VLAVSTPAKAAVGFSFSTDLWLAATTIRGRITLRITRRHPMIRRTAIRLTPTRATEQIPLMDPIRTAITRMMTAITILVTHATIHSTLGLSARLLLLSNVE